MPVEVNGYVLVISKYLLYAYYVQESLLGITEIPEHNTAIITWANNWRQFQNFLLLFLNFTFA